MFIIINFLHAVAIIIDVILQAFMFILIGRVIISWVNADPYNPIVQFIQSVTNPLLYRVRKILPPFGGQLDLSPMILILGIIFLRNFLVTSLSDLARALG
jgi:YggT family protein